MAEDPTMVTIYVHEEGGKPALVSASTANAMVPKYASLTKPKPKPEPKPKEAK